MKFSFKLLALALGMGSVCALSACHDSPNRTSNDQKTDTATSHSIEIGNTAEPTSLDPHKTSDIPSFNIIRQFLVGLVATDATGKTTPSLAERWESADNKQWTFYLRDAKWSDGTPITAQDFVYSLRRLTDPATAAPYASYLADAKVVNADKIIAGTASVDSLGVVAIDDKTLQITLTEPVPYFVDLLVLPATYAVNAKAIEQHGDAWVNPANIVVSGAYKPVEQVVGSHVKLERNSAYFDNDKTTFDTVSFLPIAGVGEISRYQAGEVDITSDVPPEQFEQIKAKHGNELVTMPRLCTAYFEYHNQVAPFNDVRVRQALSLIIDRDIITKDVLKRGEKPAYQFTPSVIAGMSVIEPDWVKDDRATRIAKAKALLNEAGYNAQNPLKFELLSSSNEIAKNVTVASQAIYKESLDFIDINLSKMEWKALQDNRKQGKYQAVLASWCADYNEPTTFLNIFKTGNENNRSRYHNTAYDALLEQAINTADSTERQKLYAQAEMILQKDAPGTFLYNTVNSRLVKPEIIAESINDPAGGWQVKDWKLKQ
ncbi:ABC transporter substrate-binding protein [uncultured Moraxella sp.]|uniref:peptide ABC transporter substrate-binding protein n=1 Tax=uncultured Moraxella sp. TaxID=263769 RepID=UPI0025F1B10A|nr:peptide ABC transporter substrate-binding protein [uncultured Moraxella sp.]